MEGWPEVAKSLDHRLGHPFGSVLLPIPLLSTQVDGHRIGGCRHTSFGHSKHCSNEKLHP